MPSLIEKAYQSVETAHAQLSEALLAGTATAAHHRQVAEAETKLVQLTSVNAATGTPAVDPSAEVEVLVREAEAVIAARLADWSKLPPPVAAEPPYHLALRLVEARTLRASQQSAIAEHAAQGARIRERVAEIDRQREAVTSRRLEGDQRPDDAAEQALLAADREGLQRLLSDHIRQTPPPPVDPSVIETEWHATLLAREATALHDYAEQVQHHLIALAQQLVALSKGKNGYRLRINLRLREAAQRGIF
jgi:hypothetical protein